MSQFKGKGTKLDEQAVCQPSNIEDLGHWKYDGEVPISTYGFIYEITNFDAGKSYIGKKQMLTVRKMPPLKGKKNKRHKTVETDWREYTSSSTQLQEDIKQLGKDKFGFRILQLCSCKWELSYFEPKLQFDRNVLLSENYYNGIVNLRVGRPPKGYERNQAI